MKRDTERPELLAAGEATRLLGAYAAGLRYADLPSAVSAKAKECVLDALGCCLIGITQPWTRMVLDIAVSSRSGNRRLGWVPAAAEPSSTTVESRSVLVMDRTGIISWSGFLYARCCGRRRPTLWGSATSGSRVRVGDGQGGRGR